MKQQQDSLFDVGSGAQPVASKVVRKAAPKVTPTRAKRGGGFATASQTLKQFQIQDKGGFISQEFQDYGYRLAASLNDLEHKSLYIRLAKTVNRQLLELAWRFVSDATARSKARLFMWKLQELRKETTQ